MNNASRNIVLTGNKSFEWTIDNNCYFIGYFYDKKGNYITGPEAVSCFKDCLNFEHFFKILNQLNGVFSIIMAFENKFFIASDKTRFFPIFYTHHKNSYYVSDNFYELAKLKNGCEINSLARDMFLSGTYTAGNKTLLNDIFEVQAGEAIELSLGKKESRLLKIYPYTDVTNIDKVSISDIFRRTGERLANSLRNKHVLLPLSGGYDSRLIACWLKDNNIQNVTCFTYGREYSEEVNVSQEVAKQLGFEWFFIEYNSELIKNFWNDQYFDDYYKYLSRGTSMFYMQEYFALRTLKDKGVLEENFIALPGHSGDLLGGSQLYKVIPMKTLKKNLAKKIFSKVFSHAPIAPKARMEIILSIQESIKELTKLSDSDIGYKVFEEWLIRERIAKYIFNSSHAFTFFGGEVRFPFWDNDFFNLWLSMPIKKRKFKLFFNKFLEEHYFERLNVNFGKKLQPSIYSLIIQRMKNQVRPHLPLKIKHKFVKKNDCFFYDEITRHFKSELEENQIQTKDNGSSYVYRILNWYLMNLERDYCNKGN